jgi:hypothetical protein
MSLDENNTARPGFPAAGAGFLAQRPMASGVQRLMAKKGIYSMEDLNERVRLFAPRLRWRRGR